MTPAAEILAALTGRLQTLVTSLPLAYREIPGDRPDEYIEVDHLPNVSERRLLAGPRLDRSGILQLTLCLKIGSYEVVYRERAGVVAAHFPADLQLSVGSTTVTIYKTDIGRGLPDGKHWRTPVSVYYRAVG